MMNGAELGLLRRHEAMEGAGFIPAHLLGEMNMGVVGLVAEGGLDGDLLPPALAFGDDGEMPALVPNAELGISQEAVFHELLRNEVTDICGKLRSYEDYGMNHHHYHDDDDDDEDGGKVVMTTLLLVQALKSNTSLQRFILNLCAIETLNHRPACDALIYFLQHNPSLKTLHLRIPPGTKSSTRSILTSKKVACPNLKELTISMPRRRPQHNGPLYPFVSVSVSTRRRRARRQRHGRPPTRRSATSNDYDESMRHYNLRGVANFIAAQPSLEYLRIQSSTFTTEQWNTLMTGVAKSRSIQTIEIRRVEPFHSSTTTLSLASLAKHPTLQSLELFVTKKVDWYPMLAQPHGKKSKTLQRLSWTSTPIESSSVRRLTSLLALSSCKLTQLEICHTNLSGSKAMMIAQMLQSNTSLVEVNLTCTHLNGLDGANIAQGLQCNSTLKRLVLGDNTLWSAPSYTAFVQFRALLQSPTCQLEYLDLSDNAIFDHHNDDNNDSRNPEAGGFGGLLEGVKENTTLKVLKISNQANLFLETMQTLGGGTPQTLPTGVSEALGQALARHPTLQELNLAYDRLGDAAIAQYVAPSLASITSTLQVLCLRRVGMGDAGMTAMATALRNNACLQHLDISFNIAITCDGYFELRETLRTMTELKTLWFHSTRRRPQTDTENFGYIYANILAQALPQNDSLTTMSHEDDLSPRGQLYLDLNRRGRKYLTKESVPDNLWPLVLGRRSDSLGVLAFFVRHKADLLASVSHYNNKGDRQPRPTTRRKRKRGK